MELIKINNYGMTYILSIKEGLLTKGFFHTTIISWPPSIPLNNIQYSSFNK